MRARGQESTPYPDQGWHRSAPKLRARSSAERATPCRAIESISATNPIDVVRLRARELLILEQHEAPAFQAKGPVIVGVEDDPCAARVPWREFNDREVLLIPLRRQFDSDGWMECNDAAGDGLRQACAISLVVHLMSIAPRRHRASLRRSRTTDRLACADRLLSARARLYCCSVNQQREPDFEYNWRVFDEVVVYTRDLVGSDGTDDLGYVHGGRIGVYDVEPLNPRARSINVVAEQFFVVTVGEDGGRWDLSYTDEDIALARRIIAATVAGRIEERKAVGRSHVVVTFEDGETIGETGYSGCALLLVPQPGWTRWGDRIRYEPYRSS